MEYQKIIHLLDKLDNTSNQPSKFRTKNWVEIDDDRWGTHNANGQIRFKTAMLNSSLFDYTDAYIHAKGTITVPNIAATGANANNVGQKVVFKNCALFTGCISEINNTQEDHAKDTDVVIPMYNLLEYRNDYSKTSRNLWQYSVPYPDIFS